MTTYPARVTPHDQRSLSITIAANFLATPLGAPLTLWLERLKILSTPMYAPYDSVIQQLLDQNGTISNTDLSILLIRIENWCRHRQTISAAMVQQNLDIF